MLNRFSSTSNKVYIHTYTIGVLTGKRNDIKQIVIKRIIILTMIENFYSNSNIDKLYRPKMLVRGLNSIKILPTPTSNKQ